VKKAKGGGGEKGVQPANSRENFGVRLELSITSLKILAVVAVKVALLIEDFSCTFEIAGFEISKFRVFFLNFEPHFVSDSEAQQVM
jgi:hypothetical protein